MEPQISQIRADYKSGKIDSETDQVIGAAMEVHRELGPGFLEVVYSEALAYELEINDVSFKREDPLKISCKNTESGCGYRVDFLFFNDVIVELKAVPELNPIGAAQVIHYLKSDNCKRGLLLNFGSRSLKHQRFTYSH